MFGGEVVVAVVVVIVLVPVVAIVLRSCPELVNTTWER